MGVTVKDRASTALKGSSKLTPAEVLDLIRSVATQVKGGGASLLTTGIANTGANVCVVRESDSSLTMAVTSTKQLVELCTFSAVVEPSGDGRTTVRVGGLESYKTLQSKVFVVIPAGPKQIYGMSAYKRFLNLVGEALRAHDPTATASIVQEGS